MARPGRQMGLVHLRTTGPRIATVRNSRSSGIRYAHAVAVDRDDDERDPTSPRDRDGSSTKNFSSRDGSSSSSGPSSGPSGDRKGKRRARDDDYRFPTKGRDGGLPTPFEVLGLDKTASQADIKAQYYRLALMLHPDASHPSSSPENFAVINQAYTLLSDPSSRRSYLDYGIGWMDDGGGRFDPRDPMMREVMRRKRAGCGRRGTGDTMAGAWGAYGMDGKWYDFPEAGVGRGEPKYMEHHKFASFVLLFGAIITWIQYHRVEMGRERLREAQHEAHLDASHALAQAREEARIHGHARREGIKRRLNESRVLKEIERQKEEAQMEKNFALAPPAPAALSAPDE